MRNPTNFSSGSFCIVRPSTLAQPGPLRIEVKKSFKGIRTGRKVNPNSARQIRLAEAKAKVEAGIQVKKGRPVVEGSARQIRIQELEARRANGEVKKGRPAKQKEEEVSLIDMLKAKS